jgi:predicted RNA-binding Zn ribbon-like protein
MMPAATVIDDDTFTFDLDGGRLCLDFANTLTPSHDHLLSYARLLAFAEQSRLITRDDLDRLQHAAQRAPERASAVLERARALRGAIYAVFTAVASDEVVPADAIDSLNVELARGLAQARVVATPDGFGWAWSTELALDRPIWPIARSAADLLTSDSERRLVRQCGADDCLWLFMDTTKNRTRQWCSMRSCGNRAKARRHYQRRRAALSTASTPNSGSAS